MYAWAYGTIYGCRPEMDLYLPVFTACSLRWYIGTVHLIAASPHESPLAIESLLQSLLNSLLDSLLDSLLERAAFERAALREE
jgi:hypothetical protein